MKGLTKKQNEILHFINDYIHQYGYSPSYKEMMQHFSLSSTGAIYKHIQTLIRKGAITAEKQCSRSIQVINQIPNTQYTNEFSLPFIGHISANNPITLFAQPQKLSVPKVLVQNPENSYVLKVEDDSFHDELISEGDLLIVEAKREIDSGDKVIGIIGNKETIIKDYYPEGQYIRLESHSNSPAIIHTNQIQVHGVIVGLIRGF